MDEKNIKDYFQQKLTIEHCSYNKEKKSCLVNSNFGVIKFEEVREKYLEKKNISDKDFLGACDSIHIHQENIYLIEFKDGKVKPKEVKSQINSSILILMDIFKLDTSKIKDYLYLIFVYNEKANSEKECEDDIPSGKLRNLTRASRFTLHYYEKLYFKEVHTLTPAQFQNEFISEWEKP